MVLDAKYLENAELYSFVPMAWLEGSRLTFAEKIGNRGIKLLPSGQSSNAWGGYCSDEDERLKAAICFKVVFSFILFYTSPISGRTPRSSCDA